MRIDRYTLFFSLLVVLSSAVFTHFYVAGLQSTNIERFTVIFIPLLTLTVHFLLVTVLPFPIYVSLAAIDALIEVGMATYTSYFQENVDLHVILGDIHEGAAVTSYAMELIPKGYLIFRVVVLILTCWFARKMAKESRKRVLLATSLVVLPLFALAVFKVPLRRAVLVTDYTICIKVHGYYTAIASDLFFTGSTPSEQDLINEIARMQKEDPPFVPDLRLSGSEPERLVLIQVESLDDAILNFRWQEKEVTPFLNQLARQTALFRLNSYHFGASGSSGADFQLLTGMLPLKNFPVFKVRTMDYRHSLPAYYKSRGIPFYVLHGNTASMWGRGFAYREMKVTHFYDVGSFEIQDARWGVSDKSLFEKSLVLMKQDQSARSAYFLITLSSHGPFDFVPNDFTSGSDLSSKYFNSINYVDRALAEFLPRLQKKTLVILYGDHNANIQSEFYHSGKKGQEFVPAMILLTENGKISKPALEGDSKRLSEGSTDIRALYYLAQSLFP